MEQLLRSLGIYFTYLEKHNRNWETNLEKTIKPLKTINNQAEQLRIIKTVGKNEIDSRLPDAKNKLILKIKACIEEEMTLLHEILKELDASNRELKKKLVIVDQNCEMVEYKDLLEASNHPLSTNMVEWASDAWKLYHAFYLQIIGAMKCLNYQDENSVFNLLKAFKEDPAMKRQIECIIAHTKIVEEMKLASCHEEV